MAASDATAAQATLQVRPSTVWLRKKLGEVFGTTGPRRLTIVASNSKRDLLVDTDWGQFVVKWKPLRGRATSEEPVELVALYCRSPGGPSEGIATTPIANGHPVPSIKSTLFADFLDGEAIGLKYGVIHGGASSAKTFGALELRATISAPPGVTKRSSYSLLREMETGRELLVEYIEGRPPHILSVVPTTEAPNRSIVRLLEEQAHRRDEIRAKEKALLERPFEIAPKQIALPDVSIKTKPTETRKAPSFRIVSRGPPIRHKDLPPPFEKEQETKRTYPPSIVELARQLHKKRERERNQRPKPVRRIDTLRQTYAALSAEERASLEWLGTLAEEPPTVAQLRARQLLHALRTGLLVPLGKTWAAGNPVEQLIDRFAKGGYGSLFTDSPGSLLRFDGQKDAWLAAIEADTSLSIEVRITARVVRLLARGWTVPSLARLGYSTDLARLLAKEAVAGTLLRRFGNLDPTLPGALLPIATHPSPEVLRQLERVAQAGDWPLDEYAALGHLYFAEGQLRDVLSPKAQMTYKEVTRVLSILILDGLDGLEKAAQEERRLLRMDEWPALAEEAERGIGDARGVKASLDNRIAPLGKKVPWLELARSFGVDVRTLELAVQRWQTLGMGAFAKQSLGRFANETEQKEFLKRLKHPRFRVTKALFEKLLNHQPRKRIREAGFSQSAIVKATRWLREARARGLASIQLSEVPVFEERRRRIGNPQIELAVERLHSNSDVVGFLEDLKTYSEYELTAQVLEAFLNGDTATRIRKRTGLSESTIAAIRQWLLAQESVAPGPPSDDLPKARKRPRGKEKLLRIQVRS